MSRSAASRKATSSWISARRVGPLYGSARTSLASRTSNYAVERPDHLQRLVGRPFGPVGQGGFDRLGHVKRPVDQPPVGGRRHRVRPRLAGEVLPVEPVRDLDVGALYARRLAVGRPAGTLEEEPMLRSLGVLPRRRYLVVGRGLCAPGHLYLALTGHPSTGDRSRMLSVREPDE